VLRPTPGDVVVITTATAVVAIVVAAAIAATIVAATIVAARIACTTLMCTRSHACPEYAYAGISLVHACHCFESCDPSSGDPSSLYRS
jgi:hypothetical protein